MKEKIEKERERDRISKENFDLNRNTPLETTCQIAWDFGILS